MPTDTEISRPPGVSLRTEGAIATLVLDLAQPKNTFRTADVQRLGALLDEALAGGARCLVIQGAGPVFSAGWDICSINPAADDPMAMIAEVVGPFCKRLRELPVPTISAVTGPALGFGFGLALCCDLCIAEDDALFGSPFRHIGMVPDSGTHHFLLSRLGHPLATELIYTGRLLSGAEAARLGLINRSVARGELAAEVDKIVQAIATGPTQALRLSKEILLQGGDFDAMFAHEGQQLAQVFSTADLKEGISAFQQRRKPVFQGR
ncbi:MAG: enoyl-CoA hydratase [Betaproteobacteria bacterium HGW-Betaproteobacteria-16]|nr:MAG: enoyl-CoA hydratase [Betaproteobacteria bacterium HGW-Betaproteobacteria-16]